MKEVKNFGNLPHKLRTFLGSKLPGEEGDHTVWECTYDEIVRKAQNEKLEPMCLIDRITGRAYISAIGANTRSILMPPFVSVAPVFYFAELTTAQKKEFVRDLDSAREQVALDTAARNAQKAEKVEGAFNLPPTA